MRKASAIKKQLIRSNDKLTDEELSNLIFKSGLSTAENVSLISGRGVGMDAVLDLIMKKGAGIELNLTAKKNHDGCRPFEILLRIPIFK